MIFFTRIALYFVLEVPRQRNVLDVLASNFALCPVDFTEVLLYHSSD